MAMIHPAETDVANAAAAVYLLVECELYARGVRAGDALTLVSSWQHHQLPSVPILTVAPWLLGLPYLSTGSLALGVEIERAIALSVNSEE